MFVAEEHRAGERNRSERPPADGPAEPDAHRGPAEPQELSELPLERLEHEITQLAAHINAGMCRWLELVGEFDRREGWGRAWGVRSCAEWVAWQCGLTPRAAREHVRVARRLPELPATRAGFARGELSYSKVRALTRIAEPDTEAELLELARNTTAAQLERIVRGLRRVGAEEADFVHSQRRLAILWEPDGSLYLRGKLPPEEGALLMRALEAARDRLYDEREERRDQSQGMAPAGSAEPPSGPAEPDCGPGFAEPGFGRAAGEPPPKLSWITNADALAAMADLSLSPGASERGGGERYQVLIHVDAEGHPVLEDGSALSPETVRRVACDASVVRLRGSPETTPSVGRRTRSIPPSPRRALEIRDPGCRFPGCDRRRFLEGHHIHHWAHGGETRADNLVRLCRHHHRLLHEGGFSLSSSPDGTLTFRRPNGSVLAHAPPPPTSAPGALARANERAGLSIGPDTCEGGLGEKLDLDWTLATWPKRLLPRRRE